jgi:predicted Fe-Mo cluster-binding NifX family protein
LKIAVPVRPDSKDRTKYVVSSAFGKAKQFAIIDNSNMGIEIIKAEVQGGKEIAKMLKDKGVNTVMVSHVGWGAFSALQNFGINVYYIDEKTPLEEAISKFKQGSLLKITEENVEKFAKHKH